MWGLILDKTLKFVFDKLKTVLPEGAKHVIDQLAKDEQIKLEYERLMLQEYQAWLQDIQSARELAKADAMSDSWLSKNIRPMTLIVIVILMAYMIITGRPITPEIKGLFATVFGFYFGGRSLEKAVIMGVNKILKSNKEGGV